MIRQGNRDIRKEFSAINMIRRSIVDLDKDKYSFSRSSVAYKQDGTQVAANVPRFEAGKFNGAVMVEESTTNLLTVAQAEGTATASYVSHCVVTPADTMHSRHGGSALEVAWDGTAGDAFVAYNLLSSLTASTPYALEVWVYAESEIYLRVGWMYIQENGGGWRSIAYLGSGLTLIPAGVWTRLTGSGTTMADWHNPTQIGLRPACDASDSYITTPIWYDTMKVEQKAYVTSWTDSTRAAETLSVPTAGVLSATAGTIERRIKLLRSPSTTEQFIFDGAGPTNQNLQVVVRTDGKVDVRYGTGSTTVTITSTTALVKDTWYAITCKWSSVGVALLINGSSVASSTTAPSLSFGTNVYLASKADGTCQLDGLLDDQRFSSIARTDQEILDAYNSGLPYQ